MLFEMHFKWLVNLVQGKVQEQVLNIDDSRIPNKSKDQFCSVFAAASCLSTRCQVDSIRVLV